MVLSWNSIRHQHVVMVKVKAGTLTAWEIQMQAQLFQPEWSECVQGQHGTHILSLSIPLLLSVFRGDVSRND